ANIRNFPYLQYKPRSVGNELAPPPQRQVYEPPVQAITQAEMGAVDHLKAATGIYDASLGNRSNETSGIAIRRRQQEGDIANYHFIDNLTTAITHEGKILVDLIPKIYDTPRVVRIIGEDGNDRKVTVNEPFVDKLTQMQKYYALKAGRYDIAVNVGPSYATKRQESAESMMQFAQVAPQMVPMYADLLVTAMAWPAADAIADRIRPPGIPKEGDPPIPPQARQMIQQLQQQNQMMQQALEEQQRIIDANKMQIDAQERMQLRDIQSKLELQAQKIGADVTQATQKVRADVAQTESKVDSQESIAQLNAEVKLQAEAMKQE